MIAVLASIFLISCTKDTEEFDSPAKGSLTEFKEMEYGPQTCDLPDGGCGSQCGGSQGGCWEQTECKANPTIFHEAMRTMYSAAEIDSLARNPTPITHPLLLKILKENNVLPLK